MFAGHPCVAAGQGSVFVEPQIVVSKETCVSLRTSARKLRDVETYKSQQFLTALTRYSGSPAFRRRTIKKLELDFLAEIGILGPEV